MKNKSKLIINIIAVIIYLTAANPAITGIMIHEWISVVCIFVFIVHCAVNYDWIIATLRRRTEKVGIAHLVLDIAILVVFMLTTVSGLMVSRYILPLFDQVAPGYFFWNPLHSITAKILLALLLIHVVTHFSWFTRLFIKKGAVDE